MNHPLESPRPAPAPWPALGSAPALAIAGAWAAVVSAVALWAHPTPLYFVETDLLGEYLPAARELLAGRLDLAHYAFKGPGYPLLLAAIALPFGGNVALAAKILSPLAMALAAWFAFLLARRAAGESVASFTLFALLAAPVVTRYAIEAGTDAPATALMLAATWLIVSPGSWRRPLAAGAMAALAILTRGNAVFLVPCALLALALRADRKTGLVAYGAGLALPLGAWWIVAASAGGVPVDRNYLNVAWELYGQGVPWDRFESAIGGRFHSLFDVLAFDPLRTVSHIGGNLFTHRVHDVRELMPPWLAVLALPGLALLVAAPRSRVWLAHGAACAAILAAVFYNARFELYLLPVYVAAAGAALAWAWSRVAHVRFARPAAVALASALVIASAVSGAVETGQRLADAPDETRLAGEALARTAPRGASIMARRPHVAYFAGLTFVPYPPEGTLPGLPAYAREAGARYLFYSPLEQVQRPEYGVLADSGVALPGLTQVAWRRQPNDRFYAIYELAPAADTTGFVAAYRRALRRYEKRRHDAPEALLFVSLQQLELGDAGDALDRLDRLTHAGAVDAQVERYRSVALARLGRLDEAEQACRQSMALAPATAWHWSQLGDVQARGGRYGPAAAAYAKAVELQPTSTTNLERLGRCLVADGKAVRAAAAFEQALALDPHQVTMRRLAMGAWQLAGNESRMRELYADGLDLGATAEELLGAGHAPPAEPEHPRLEPAGSD